MLLRLSTPTPTFLTLTLLLLATPSVFAQTPASAANAANAENAANAANTANATAVWDANDRRVQAATTLPATPLPAAVPIASPPASATAPLAARSNPFLGRTARSEELLLQLEEERLRTQIANEKVQQAKAAREVAQPVGLAASHGSEWPQLLPVKSALTPANLAVATTTAPPRSTPSPRRVPLVAAPPLAPIAAPVATPFGSALPASLPKLVGVITGSGSTRHVMVAHAGKIVTHAEGHGEPHLKIGEIRSDGAFINGVWTPLNGEPARLRAPERPVPATVNPAVANHSGQALAPPAGPAPAPAATAPAAATASTTSHVPPLLDFVARP
jgi:hypothetical protein